MTESGERTRVASALGFGALFPALVVAIAASAPLVNDQFITPVDGRILTIAWWFMVPLGVAGAIIKSRRQWTGIVIGLWCVVAFHLSLVLLMPVVERAAALWEPASWLAAALAVAVPWALGMALGWTSVQGRPRRLDGTSAHTTE